MKKSTKIILLVAALLFLIAAVMLVWRFEPQLLDSGLEFLVYTIGYGDANANVLIRLALAVIGISLVGVFSSFITVIFIEQKSKLKLGNKLNLHTGDAPRAYISIKTKQWELFDVEAKLMYSLNGNIYEDSCVRYPYLKSNQKLDIDFDLQQGSVLFWYLQSVQEKKHVEEIIVKVDFINGSNNQSYSAIKKYSVENDFVIDGENRCPNETELQKLCRLEFNMDKLIPINEKYIGFRTVQEPLPFCKSFSNGICAHVDLAEANIDNFGMLMFPSPFLGNWEFIQNEGYELAFKVYATADIDLRLEIKSSNNPGMIMRELKAANKLETFTVRFDACKPACMQSITEMCFTAFKRENTASQGDIYIFDCCMQKTKNIC